MTAFCLDDEFAVFERAGPDRKMIDAAGEAERRHVGVGVVADRDGLGDDDREALGRHRVKFAADRGDEAMEFAAFFLIAESHLEVGIQFEVVEILRVSFDLIGRRGKVRFGDRRDVTPFERAVRGQAQNRQRTHGRQRHLHPPLAKK